MTEVSEKEVQTITMDDKEYRLDEVTDKAKYLVAQVQDMQAQANQTRARLDQIEVGIQGFTNLLKDFNRIVKPESRRSSFHTQWTSKIFEDVFYYNQFL